MGVIRILFVADTHLGFDQPARPRVQRRRRGDDFMANYMRVLGYARKEGVDALVHGGDLFFRSRIPAGLVDRAFAPLKEIADLGIKVYVVPGNHERSKIPFRILTLHPNIHMFDHPRTFVLEARGKSIALSGFPYWRENVRNRFPEILDDTGWRKFEKVCDGRLLCVHHCFEGATVGPSEYVFRSNGDVIRLKDIPEEFTAVFSGHIHRFQVLEQDLRGQPIPVPVFYPGSIERTSFAEMNEKKGFLMMEFGLGPKGRFGIKNWEFIELPTRPMVNVTVPSGYTTRQAIMGFLKESFKKLDPQSVARLIVDGDLSEDCLSVLRTASIRALCPESMNLCLRFKTRKSRYLST